MAKIKFAKLVHLVGLIIKKFGTMHGHMNVKSLSYCRYQVYEDGWGDMQQAKMEQKNTKAIWVGAL